MTDHDPIAHLDFAVPPELDCYQELLRFESLESTRLQIVKAFFGHLADLDAAYGPIDLSDPDSYVKRLRLIEELMTAEVAASGLVSGDLIQAHVPNVVYPADFVAQFDDGESIRARFDHVAIYPHYKLAPSGELVKDLPFGLNLSVSEPVAVGIGGSYSIEAIAGLNPMISLHHDSADLHRVILP